MDKTTPYEMEETTSQGPSLYRRLDECDEEKDLGVWVDSELTFKKHVQQATTKARRTLSVIRRSFDHLSPETFTQLYKSLVRSTLEYGHSVWQPRHKTLCKEIERVQKSATKLIAKIKDKPYNERLEELKLPSLEHRRARGDLIDTYKYVHGIYNVDRPKLLFHNGRETRGHCLKLSKPRHLTNIRANFFTNRVITPWNNLPEEVVTAPSVNSFKNRLDKHWAELPTLFNPTCCT
jgi:hypothetical protein